MENKRYTINDKSVQFVNKREDKLDDGEWAKWVSIQKQIWVTYPLLFGDWILVDTHIAFVGLIDRTYSK